MVGIGLIGTGYWGKNHARNWKRMLDDGIIDKLVFCDIDEKRVKELAGDEIPYTTNYKDLLNDDEISGIDIVTPSNTHFPLGKEALIAGKDVFVEKPLTMSTKEAEELVSTAENCKKILMVGHIFRYHPGILEVKKMIEKGDFGRMHYMYTTRMAYSTPRRDMGVMYALGVHELDLYCYLLGVQYPNLAKMTKGSFLQPNIEEFASILMEFDNNISGYATESWMSPFDKKMRTLTIVGSRKSVKVDYMKHNEIYVFDGIMESRQDGNQRIPFVSEGEIRTISIPEKEPLREELCDFVNSINTRKQPLADMYSGMRAVEMVEKCLRDGFFRPDEN
ncbi:Gfo/Idh/MocA family oxidoreductase [Methanoplanus sp. FWC-SCC4]|uniref:Gfo/Idh/MocA family oxidoreductase n=1 Tax=Methanochimaera problematica TaxID=2609417 RepID=A0AA97FCW4_9EURY|nr:Gfo/Idh/MocA family oxidoreductase [Methanoplanus sp. FWC-SCC4]WOF17090.1 Gfo/Idh/MocA family oxidoreductase [Methanoplanus sp. FWC-SCC4]